MIWDAIMLKDEFDMLDCRMEALAGHDVTTVAVESRHTHQGVPKPLHLAGAMGRYAACPLRRVVDDWEPDPDPWVNEHVQRNRAWPVIDAEAADTDVVLICDLDEIPSSDLLACAAQYGAKGPGFPLRVFMKTYLFAVDWEADWAATGHPEPATCVMAPVRFLREQAASGRYLAEVRDDREQYMPLIRDDGGRYWGWHFSWVGGPEAQARKLDEATCHTEILATPEAALIRSGARWRSAEDGGGLPVVPVDDLSGHPAYVREGRCPPEWLRPRSEEGAA